MTEIDPRLTQFSYSTNKLLHLCPKLFQLSRLQAVQKAEDKETSVTFAYGKAVGKMVQDYCSGVDYKTCIWNAYLIWDVLLTEEDRKRKKSFWLAIVAFDRFISLAEEGELALEEYEVMLYNGKPANELSFIIHLPNGFTYKGYIDLVLRNKISGKLLIVDCKTTSSYNVAPAMYQNSAQGIGYSVVLDAIFPEASGYEVCFLVYKTRSMEWVDLEFTKTALQRAHWINALMIDTSLVETYEELGYPINGESCFNYYRECTYFGVCEIETKLLTVSLTDEDRAAIDKRLAEEFDIVLTLEDIINTQQKRIEA